jgi:hypothetical protein
MLKFIVHIITNKFPLVAGLWLDLFSVEKNVEKSSKKMQHL